MKPPITIDDHGDINIFETIEEAEKYVEPIDARRGDFVAYDSEGRLLRSQIVKRGLLGPRVKLEPTETVPKHASALRARLIGFLSKLGESRPLLEADSLDGLITRTIRLLAPHKDPKA
jgi:hypothetical protein